MGLFKSLFKVAGAVVGGAVGGPQGAVAGAKVGGKVGGAVKGKKKKKGEAAAPRIPELDLSGLMSPISDIEGTTRGTDSEIAVAPVAASPFGNPAFDLMAQWDQVLRLEED